MKESGNQRHQRLLRLKFSADSNLWLTSYGFCEMAYTVSYRIYIRGEYVMMQD